MKIIITEKQNKRLIKTLNEQDSWVLKAASGPQKCGLTKGGGDDCSQARQDRRDDRINRREDKRSQKQSDKQSSQERMNLLNPNMDSFGSKLDKNGINNFNKNYSDFLRNNPGFESEQTGYKPEQVFSVLNKIVGGFNRNPDWWVTNKIKTQFSHQGTLTEKQLYDYSKKLGSFDDFINFVSL